VDNFSLTYSDDFPMFPLEKAVVYQYPAKGFMGNGTP